MPVRAPRICSCGRVVASGATCSCTRIRKAESDACRPNASARGYDGVWRAEAKAFLRANPTCKRCGAPATLVDHLIPHRGVSRLFWNRSNWQPLCTTCHSRAKQAAEKRRAWAVNGAPEGTPGGGRGLAPGGSRPVGVHSSINRRNEVFGCEVLR
ncbi:HNH endonuclease [Rhodoplanes roseus]|uniref:HNH nuclease domain-containing protein n=1 Tax=Rhodoplanes roseus TaxID=29409 RepID=A0A327KYL4_9BRAD|nr:hypothetical protein CH341_11420 [Rhodoplanes roseus]